MFDCIVIQFLKMSCCVPLLFIADHCGQKQNDFTELQKTADSAPCEHRPAQTKAFLQRGSKTRRCQRVESTPGEVNFAEYRIFKSAMTCHEGELCLRFWNGR